MASAAGRVRTNHGRNDGVDGGCAHAAPARAAQHRRDEQLPRRRRGGPAEDADGQGERPGLGHHRQRQSADGMPAGCAPTDRADQEMDCDRRRDQRQRPAPRIADHAQEDGRTVEAHPPAEHGQHESRADDAPSVERAAAMRYCRHQSTSSSALSAVCSRQCYGDDRSIDVSHARTRSYAPRGVARINEARSSAAGWRAILRSPH